MAAEPAAKVAPAIQQTGELASVAARIPSGRPCRNWMSQIVVAVNANTNEPEAAMAFIRFSINPE